MIEKIEMVDKEAFEYYSTPKRTIEEIRLFADKLNEVIDTINNIKYVYAKVNYREDGTIEDNIKQ